jgi:hypothetical protein
MKRFCFSTVGLLSKNVTLDEASDAVGVHEHFPRRTTRRVFGILNSLKEDIRTGHR